MTQNSSPSLFPPLFVFLVGAAVGAVVVALTTPKSGPRLRKDLKHLGRCGRERAHLVVNGLRGIGRRSRRTYVWHVPGPENDIHISVDDLPG